MAHLWTPQDLPSDFKLGWYHFPDSATVTLDASSKIASIENKFDNGSRPCATPSNLTRHVIQQFNGYDTAYSPTVNTHGGILMQNTTGLPTGNADLCMIFVAMSQDGVVGGYRGGNNYWVDNPFPDYRLRTNGGDFTATGSTNNTALHTAIFNRSAGKTNIRVDGTDRGTHTPTSTYNTTLGTFGIKGADNSYYVMKGSTLGAIVGKRAATADEMFLIEKWYSTFTGQTVPASNPYAASLPMVEDAGGGTTVSGTATMTGTGVLAASGVTMARASSAMIGTGGIAATGTAIASGSAALSGVGAFVALSNSAISRVVSLAGSSTFAASSMAVAGRIVSFAGSSALAVISRRTATTTAAMAGTSTFVAKPPAPPTDPAEEATIGMQLVPVDGKRTDWPRLVANAVNALIKEYRVRVTNPFMQLDTAPFQPTEGQTYYDTTLHQVRVWNGTTWIAL